MKHVVNEISLDNGIKGLLVHLPGASVFGAEIHFRAGYYLAPNGKWETPHVMEHMIGATEEYPSMRQFHAVFERNGAYGNAYTSTYSLGYEFEAADFEWERILDLQLQAIEKPLLSEYDLASERGNVREELTGFLSNNGRILGQKMAAASGVLSLDYQTRLKQLSDITINDVRAHYHTTHRSDNMRFIIAGDMKRTRPEKISAKMQSMVLQRGARFELPLEEPKHVPDLVFVRRKDVPSIQFELAMFRPARLSRGEEWALRLLDIIMTGTFHSRIFGEAREKGLVYHISSGYDYARDFSSWGLWAEVSPRYAEKLFMLIAKEIKAAMDGHITQDELKAAQDYALGRHQRSAQTISGTIRSYSNSYFYDEFIEDHDNIPERIKAVSVEQMVDVINRLVGADRWCFGALSSVPPSSVQALHEILKEIWV